MTTLSRRAFALPLEPRPPAAVVARGREAWAAALRSPEAADSPAMAGAEVCIDSNENPTGPGPAALEILASALDGQVGRYPFNTRPAEADLVAAVAESCGAKPENVVLGAGSSEILRNAVRAFTSPERPFVTASPTFELPERLAEAAGLPVRRVPVDSNLRLDLEAMARAAKGAGLVFVCNPNNPTATVHPARAIADFVTRVSETSPGTVILLDEAYHDYVTDPAYATGLPLALSSPNVLVARTFSKAHGMAGLRVGYAVGTAATAKGLGRYRMAFGVNVPTVAAAIASLRDPGHIARERARNTAVRSFTLQALAEAGCKATDGQTNFVFVEIGRPAKVFREACALQRILVGRDFPPFEKSYARISIGTMDEMQRAAEVFRSVLKGSGGPRAA